MLPFSKIDAVYDVDELSEWLSSCDLWDKHNQRRTIEGSPHSKMVDIWARYKDPAPHIASGDWSDFDSEHESVWLEVVPFLKDICRDLMAKVKGKTLGGVLITKLPAGESIAPHVDSGWHAQTYDKYFLAVKNGIGSVFGFDDGLIESENGEVYKFDNSVKHWVNNNSAEDRIAVIICIN
jgi:hypothetical protein